MPNFMASLSRLLLFNVILMREPRLSMEPQFRRTGDRKAANRLHAAKSTG
jgi:hypothetical protein